MKSLYEQFKEAGCNIENHYSDMYVEYTPKSKKNCCTPAKRRSICIHIHSPNTQNHMV